MFRRIRLKVALLSFLESIDFSIVKISLEKVAVCVARVVKM